MPFKSDKQRKFLYSQHPEIAKRWSEEEKSGKTTKKKTPKRKRKVTKGK